MTDQPTGKLDVPKQTVTVAGQGPTEPTPATIENALVSLGQRRVNIIWERTQAVVALSVVEATVLTAVFLALQTAQPSASSTGTAGGVAFIFLVGAANLVIGFYFGRTNHAKTGGIGGGEVTGDR